jgi:hypothetical protein
MVKMDTSSTCQQSHSTNTLQKSVRILQDVILQNAKLQNFEPITLEYHFTFEVMWMWMRM